MQPFFFYMVLGLLNQLQIFWMLCLIELLGLLTSQGLDMLDFFTNLGVLEFLVRYLALFLLFSVIGGFGWFWMGSLHKNIQLMLEFLRSPFLVLQFSYCILMTFLMILSVILLSMLIILRCMWQYVATTRVGF